MCRFYSSNRTDIGTHLGCQITTMSKYGSLIQNAAERQTNSTARTWSSVLRSVDARAGQLLTQVQNCAPLGVSSTPALHISIHLICQCQCQLYIYIAQCQTGRDHEDAPASHGWAPYSRIWDPIISHCLKQWIWPRTGLCGGCGRHMALCNLKLHARNDSHYSISTALTVLSDGWRSPS